MLTDQFLINLKQKYLDAITRLNTGSAFTKRQWDFVNKAGTVEVNALRGSVFEKACVSNIHATVTIPGRDYQSTIQWLGIQTFPANPNVPIFMGVFEQVSEQGTEHYPGFFDVYPTIPYEDDKHYIQNQMRAIAQKHGRDYGDLTAGYLKMFQIKEAGSGIGYGTGMCFEPEESNFAFFQDAATAIFNTYFSLVEKRKDSAPSSEQIDEMFIQRAEWTRYTFMDNRFFRGGISLGVPPESFMLHMLPPLVKF